MQPQAAKKEQARVGDQARPGTPEDWGSVPKLAPGWDPAGSSLSPAEGFLLSRIDGHTPWGQLRQMGGIPAEEVDRCLRRWLGEGMLVVSEAKGMSVEIEEEGAGSPSDGAAETASAATGEARLEDALEPGIDLPEELQRRILAFEASLERPYHDLLGVTRDADGKAIKRAYFTLSKEFHPDRYYRRKIGGFLPRLESIFKKVVEAYELLSDPTTRAEIEKSMAASPPPSEAREEPAAAADPKSADRLRRREMLERLRRQFRIPEEVLTERKFKASQFFQSAMIAGKKGQWLEAAASVRLAIAFDPWNQEYKAGFAEVQAQVHQVRAAKLLEEAGSLDAGAQHEAMRLYEEALSYRPADADINHRAARVALELEELDKAHEYASAAVELAPETAACHVTLARVLRKLGRFEKARKACEEARRVEPDSDEAKALLNDLRKKPRRGGGLR